jgi:hypothetical protein
MLAAFLIDTDVFKDRGTVFRVKQPKKYTYGGRYWYVTWVWVKSVAS